MIIIRYLIRETFKTQVAILFVLLLIFFCQKLVKILSAAVDGDIPTSLVLSLLALGVPEMIQLILPLSLFLGILLTYSKLYAESEITVMHACGLSRRTLLQAALLLSLFTLLFSAVNSFWFGPWSAINEEKIVAEARANPGMATLIEGQFKKSNDGNSVIFVGNVNGNQFNNIFLAQLTSKGAQRPSIIIAKNGYITQQPDGSQVVFLDQGRRYEEGASPLLNFRNTEFNNYQAIIDHQEVKSSNDNNDVEQQSLAQLRQSATPAAKAELSWRLTLLASVILMAIMVVPLSVINPRQGRVVSMLPAMLLYLIYFLLQSSLRSNGAKGRIDPMTWMWIVNAGYFILAICLNGWDSLAMRRLRARFRGND